MSVQNQSIVFITGLGGTGKSSIWSYFLENPMTGYSFFDFEKGKYDPPEYDKHQTEHLSWRIKQNNWWLEVAANEFKVRGNVSVIIGFSLYPKSMTSLPNAKFFTPESYHFGILTCSEEERKKRLCSLGCEDQWKGHEPWFDEFFKEMKNEGAREIDTSQNSVEQTALTVKEWLESLRT